MICLPTNLRSLVIVNLRSLAIANCIGRRSYAASAFAQKVNTSELISRALASKLSQPANRDSGGRGSRQPSRAQRSSDTQTEIHKLGTLTEEKSSKPSKGHNSRRITRQENQRTKSGEQPKKGLAKPKRNPADEEPAKPRRNPADEEPENQRTKSGRQPKKGPAKPKRNPADEEPENQRTKNGKQPKKGPAKPMRNPADEEPENQRTKNGKQPKKGPAKPMRNPADEEPENQRTKSGRLPKKGPAKPKKNPADEEPAGADVICTPVELDNKVYNENRDAKIDIYNYAALSGLVPEFEFGISKEILKRVRRRGGSRKTSLKKVTIRLPEQGIEVSAQALEIHMAEVAACMEFKREAEKYQSSQAGNINKHPSLEVLSTETTEKFFNHFKRTNKHQVVEFNQTRMRKPGLGDRFHSWVTIDGEPVGKKVECESKDVAHRIARLVAAIELYKQDPQVMESFKEALVIGKGNIIEPASPVYVDLNQHTIEAIDTTLHRARRAGLPDNKGKIVGNLTPETNYHNRRHTRTPGEFERRSLSLIKSFREYLDDPQLKTLREAKQALPMNRYAEKVLQMINENPFSIVVGATGSGKTTQVPQILFDDATRKGKGAYCNIVCTQPRRIAAISVAQRVAAERNETVGVNVGYHVRFDRSAVDRPGSINYCTTGILLEQLKSNPDEILEAISHLVVDEVHERDLNIDFLMIVLKNAIRKRKAAGKPAPKVILMSATLDTELFANYFNESNRNGEVTLCPSISVPGRTFPVKEMFLDDILSELQDSYGAQYRQLISKDKKSVEYLNSEGTFSASNKSASFGLEGTESVVDWKRRAVLPNMPGALSAAEEQLEALIPNSLVVATLAHICRTTSNGAILIFLPGLVEITDAQKSLTSPVFGVNFADTSKYKIFVLHSAVPKEEQSAVFGPVPPGCRKIILSTNIAETSVTIPDVQHVIDTGKMREKRYHQMRRITKLQCTWVSKSNSKQRAGRAGRVQNGNYYALFSRERFEMLRTISLPELLRSDLQETCLATKAQAFDSTVGEFLAQAIEPPSPDAVESAVDNLKALEAFTEDEKFTPLGRLLAKLPVHPTLGKMIVLGVIFRCLDPLLILGAASGERFFMSPIEGRAAARAAHRPYDCGHQSDHLALLNAFQDLRNVVKTQGQQQAYRYAMSRYLHFGSFRNIDSTAQQIHDILSQVGLIPSIPGMRNARLTGSQYGHPDLNKNSGNVALVRGLILAGFYPNLAYRIGDRVWRTATESKVIVSQTSVNNRLPVKTARSIATYGVISEGGGGLGMRDTTIISPLTVLLFGGKLKQVPESTRLEMDNWLPFAIRASGMGHVPVAKRIFELKGALCDVLSNAFQSLLNPQQGSGGFHAFENVREIMAQGLIDVLNNEAAARMSRFQLHSRGVPLSSRLPASGTTSPQNHLDRQS